MRGSSASPANTEAIRALKRLDARPAAALELLERARAGREAHRAHRARLVLAIQDARIGRQEDLLLGLSQRPGEGREIGLLRAGGVNTAPILTFSVRIAIAAITTHGSYVSMPPTQMPSQ